MQQNLSQVTGSLWALPSRSMAYNSGVFISAEQAAIIDPGPHPDEVERMLLFVASQRSEIAAVVLTHSHWDHILGPERMRPELIVTTSLYEKVTRRDRQQIGAMVARWEGRFGYERAKPFATPRPDATFEDAIQLDIGNLSLQLLAIPGHAEDQLAVYEPASAALWAADTLSDIEIPYVAHSLAAYEGSLARLARLEVAALVPGHGRPTRDAAEIAGRFAQDRAYLAELRGRVAAAVAGGLSLEETLARCADMPIRDEGLNGQPHRLNVESAYIELGGPADPDAVGWRKKNLIDE